MGLTERLQQVRELYERMRASGNRAEAAVRCRSLATCLWCTIGRGCPAVCRCSCLLHQL